MLHESLAPRYAHHALDVPRSAAHLTCEWLTAVLCRNIPQARVLDFGITNGSSGTSTRAALQLELNAAALDGGVPQHLFTKSTPRLTQRVMQGYSGIIRGEPGFYALIRPQLDIEAPHGYHASLDEASWRSFVLMEDVTISKGARFVTIDTHITQVQMQDLLTNMARWHARFWDSPQLRQNLRWLRTPAGFVDTIVPLGFGFLCRLGLRRAQHVVPAAVRAQTPALWRALPQSLSLRSDEPHTLLHGDPHIGQTYLTCDGRMGHADWQIVMQGCWAFDVAYAIASSLTVEDRRDWECELLRFYLDRLHAADGPMLAFDAAWRRYRQHLIYPWFCWLMTAAGPVVPFLPNMQTDRTSLAIIARIAQAIEDLDPLAAVTESGS